MKFQDIYHRRPQHVGVINQAVWSAHDRGAGDNGVPCS